MKSLARRKEASLLRDDLGISLLFPDKHLRRVHNTAAFNEQSWLGILAIEYSATLDGGVLLTLD